MSKTEYISLLDGGIRHTTGMHIGQDLRKLELVYDSKVIDVNSLMRIVQYTSRHKTIELLGVIYYFPALNEFLQTYHDKKCNMNLEIYEATEKKLYTYTEYNLKLLDFEITYSECNRSEIKLVFQK